MRLDAPSVLALSWGKGDPLKDPVHLVFLDEAGRMREYTKIDNLQDSEMVEEFTDILKKRKPDVIVVGGMSISTLKLTRRVKDILKGGDIMVRGPAINGQAFDVPIIYVFDDVARIYQHSNRAVDEFSALPTTARYCVGLARYAQSPLNEFAALGSDIAAITLEEDQHLVSIHDVFRFVSDCVSGAWGENADCFRACFGRCNEQSWSRHQSRGRRFVLSKSFDLRLWLGSTKDAELDKENRRHGKPVSLNFLSLSEDNIGR